MSANTYINVTELDFEQIRSNLKRHLSSREDFKDYDFEGSAIATLLDVLSYNTHYNAYYLNMLANEMFLDTAQQRESVVSHAKLLGYTPVSAIGAQANVALTFTGVEEGTTQITIPKNSKFSVSVDDVTYTYVTPEATRIISATGTFANNVIIKEGEPLTHRYTYSEQNPERIILPNKNIDLSSIVVNVQESSSTTTRTEFTRATNLVDIYGTSNVYFLEEVADEKYEIIFGNGTLGKALVDGNVVIIDYLVCNGGVTNGAENFSVDSINLGVNYENVTISTNTTARGGRSAEDIESIKYNAPKIYQTQNRCVIDNDYQRILLNENADLESVVAFGGEKASPPVYGKVYVAVKPFGELFTTVDRKNKIKNSINDRTPLGIDPVIIDPSYTYLIPAITTYYDKTKTNLTNFEIESQVKDQVAAFSSKNLGRFGDRLRYSRFVRSLDNVLPNVILNNDASIKMQKRIAANTDVAEKLEMLFHNAIRPGTLSSTQFTYGIYSAYVDDDGEGNVNIYRFNENKQKVNIKQAAGTIDYDTGEIVIEAFAPTAYTGNFIRFDVTPEKLDIIPVREQILLLNSQDTNITIIAEYT